jgi:hypothetical protein
MRITVDVIYALPYEQIVGSVTIDQGATALEAVAQSGLMDRFPKLRTTSTTKFGIYGQIIESPASYVLQAGDRVEIYRPLLIDPKEARRQRAEKLQKTTPNE